MEVEIIKEIMDYREGVFKGLPLRELIGAASAAALSMAAYFTLHSAAVCVIVSVPPIIAGFYKYNGMTGGVFLRQLIKDNLTMPKHLTASQMNSQMFYHITQIDKCTTGALSERGTNEHNQKDS